MAIEFKTAAAKRGELIVTVTATETLAPVNQVDVDSVRSKANAVLAIGIANQHNS
jgi:hypothetical protein